MLASLHPREPQRDDRRQQYGRDQRLHHVCSPPTHTDAEGGRMDSMGRGTLGRSGGPMAEVFDLHALKAFAGDKRVRKLLFKTDQLWSEIACYEPGQSSVMHTHPKEEEAIFVLEGTATMSIDGSEMVVPAGSIVKFPNN